MEFAGIYLGGDMMVIGSGALGMVEYRVVLLSELEAWYFTVETVPAQLLSLRLQTNERIVRAVTDDAGRCCLGPLTPTEAAGPIELFAEMRPPEE